MSDARRYRGITGPVAAGAVGNSAGGSRLSSIHVVAAYLVRCGYRQPAARCFLDGHAECLRSRDRPLDEAGHPPVRAGGHRQPGSNGGAVSEAGSIRGAPVADHPADETHAGN